MKALTIGIFLNLTETETDRDRQKHRDAYRNKYRNGYRNRYGNRCRTHASASQAPIPGVPRAPDPHIESGQPAHREPFPEPPGSGNRGVRATGAGLQTRRDS